MAREFSRKFYKSKEWKRVREYIFNKYHGLCNKCGKPGEEVHHIIWLSPKNMNDIDITLGEDNLVLLCRDCHVGIHRKINPTKSEYKFNENGELVPVNAPL
ncbi:HNH endonuclease signature motif containing protein [Romboutsia sp.]|uniref:HNH endonuclease n=1 Tax=Romboutsia sp. TaxID=1965302 RepID=UPI002BD22CEE|nr:HNH endonuclease signature motif containing protein [Romboutsia sp.]HSQ90012.1 HNH endonuclease signature motif containing protein [Romboutsia sp.]